MATALAAATAHSTWGRWQRTAAVELDAAGRTNGERLLLWTTAAAVAAATAHSNCGRRQLTAAVEWDAAGRTDGERLLLWMTVAATGGDHVCGWEQSTSGENGRWLCQQKYDKHEKVRFLGICL